MEETRKLKPVIFEEGRQLPRYSHNTHMQTILLKALSEGVTDVNELRKISGAKTAADVFRTLDKLALRREYQTALATNGITLDSIAGKINDLITNGSDKIKLGALQVLMKSLGLDKYEKEEDSGKSWEETILELSDKESSPKLMLENKTSDYNVIQPPVPDSVKKRQEDEKQLAKELYGK